MLKLEELPPRISEYMGGYYPALKNVRIAKRYGLSEQQADDFVLLIGAVFRQGLELEQLPNALRQRLGLNPGRAFLLAAEVGEQHLAAFEDFLGPVNQLVEQWRQWGHDLGGQQPGHVVDEKFEQFVQAASKQPVTGVELPSEEARSQTSTPTNGSPGSARGMDLRNKPVPPASTSVSGQDRQAQGTPVPTTPPATPGMSREQFLSQVQQFSIDKLRPAGQPAVQRLEQIRASLSHVVSTTPADQPALAQALHASPLFHLYHDMGQESLRTQQSIDHVIYNRYQAGQPYLLREEFEAVGQLAAIATPATTVANQPATT